MVLMNASDILKYGNLTVLRTIAGLPEDDWETNGVCGWWSVKNILSHLASFEYVLVDIFRACLAADSPTPDLAQFTHLSGDDFNANQVDMRKDRSVKEVLEEYQAKHVETMAFVKQIPVETLRQPGTLPWYGLEYALDDFIVYTFYGHKREHSAQVAVFRDRIKR
jgi:hypothetical protein